MGLSLACTATICSWVYINKKKGVIGDDVHMGFWFTNPHTGYAQNDTIGNLIKAIKALYCLNKQTSANLEAEIIARKEADDEIIAHMHKDLDDYASYDDATKTISLYRRDNNGG